MGMSNILGALVAFTLSSLLSQAQLQSWGWRIPFIVGLLIAPAGLMLRRSLHETTDFESDRARRRQTAVARSPLRLAFGAHGGALAVGFGLSILWAVAVYVLNIYTPVYVQRAFGFSAQQAFAASLIGNVLFVIGCLAAGRLSDRVGRRAMLAAGACALLLGVLPLYHWLQVMPTTAVLIMVQSAFCVMVASFVGVAPAALSDLFPTSDARHRHLDRVQRGLRRVRRLCAADPDLVHAPGAWLRHGTRRLCHLRSAGRTADAAVLRTPTGSGRGNRRQRRRSRHA